MNSTRRVSNRLESLLQHGESAAAECNGPQEFNLTTQALQAKRAHKKRPNGGKGGRRRSRSNRKRRRRNLSARPTGAQ